MLNATDQNTLQDLEAFFKTAVLPGKVLFAPGSTITNVPKFIDAQLKCARAEGTSPVKRLALERLIDLRSILTKP